MHSYSDKLKSFIEHYKEANIQVAPTTRILQLALDIEKWHAGRNVPERWQPVVLGRVAALFGVSREVAAAALTVAGWLETRSAGRSLWQAPTSNNKEV
jgi:hypothetical protein